MWALSGRAGQHCGWKHTDIRLLLWKWWRAQRAENLNAGSYAGAHNCLAVQSPHSLRACVPGGTVQPAAPYHPDKLWHDARPRGALCRAHACALFPEVGAPAPGATGAS